jgi:endonuclease/exonuclease/phosphatase family metal-dependent hydrolase
MNHLFSQRVIIKVLTLNIHSGVDWFGRFRPETLLQFLKKVDPDLCGLQEVDSRWSPRSLFYKLNSYLVEGLMMHQVFSPSLTHLTGSYGNLILSKFPIVNSWVEQLPGRGETRSFCCVQPELPGDGILFLTTHLGLSVEDRNEQAVWIRAFLSGNSRPVILTGDFNASRDEESICNLTAGFIDPHLWGPWSDDGTFRCKDGSMGPRIDYLLFTPEFRFYQYRVIDNFLSDHLPVYAEVELKARKSVDS